MKKQQASVKVTIEVSGAVKSLQAQSYVAVEVLRQVFSWAARRDHGGNRGRFKTAGDEMYTLMSALRGPDEQSAKGADALKGSCTALVRRVAMGGSYAPPCLCKPSGYQITERMVQRAIAKARGGPKTRMEMLHVRSHLVDAFAVIGRWWKEKGRRKS